MKRPLPSTGAAEIEPRLMLKLMAESGNGFSCDGQSCQVLEYTSSILGAKTVLKEPRSLGRLKLGQWVRSHA